jgi:hypothetical protein
MTLGELGIAARRARRENRLVRDEMAVLMSIYL